MSTKAKMTIYKIVSAFLLSLWFSLSGTVQALLILMAVDFATGIGAAYIEKKIDSRKSREGFVTKALILLLIFAISVLAKVIDFHFNIGGTLAIYYCFTEVVSITENCARANAPIPTWLTAALVKAQKATGSADRSNITKLDEGKA